MNVRMCLLLLLLDTTSRSAIADPRALDEFTSFEPADTGPVFGSGTTTAVFTGGGAAVIGIPSLYHSGSYSWEVPSGTTTQIDFSTPAAVVEFFALDSGVADATIRAFNPQGGEVGFLGLTNSFSSPPGNFSNPLIFSGAIAQLVIENPGGGSAWIDDFGFSVVPEPGSAVLLLAGMVLLESRTCGRRRRQLCL